jgi:hypothetical protein
MLMAAFTKEMGLKPRPSRTAFGMVRENEQSNSLVILIVSSLAVLIPLLVVVVRNL